MGKGKDLEFYPEHFFIVWVVRSQPSGFVSIFVSGVYFLARGFPQKRSLFCPVSSTPMISMDNSSKTLLSMTCIVTFGSFNICKKHDLQQKTTVAFCGTLRGWGSQNIVLEHLEHFFWWSFGKPQSEATTKILSISVAILVHRTIHFVLDRQFGELDFILPLYLFKELSYSYTSYYTPILKFCQEQNPDFEKYPLIQK